ncbi:ras-related protein Rab-36 isoform X2 [Pseudophryne corroboree]|uniref:ras-related protein Rab-36 isoform X2 n=1 Tax=Pseudophryne corroboree TaxID=495146 RepID=UPI0030812E87
MLSPQLPPVPRDRLISQMPKCYTAESCLQYRTQFDAQVKNACKQRHAGNFGLKMSKVVMVGDLYVGKTSLINRWDTAGQEKFKCIASAYYRGAQVIITAFDLGDIHTLEHTKQWLQDALRENEPNTCSVFLVGTKKDTLSDAECERTEQDALKFAVEMQAEYWSVSAKTGENVKDFFFRVAAVTFEQCMKRELEKNKHSITQIGTSSLIQLDGNSSEKKESDSQNNMNCC